MTDQDQTDLLDRLALLESIARNQEIKTIILEKEIDEIRAVLAGHGLKLTPKNTILNTNITG